MKWFVSLKAVVLKLFEFFQDGDRMASATRLSQHMTICTTLGLWVKACATAHWVMVPVDHTHILLVATVMGAKVVQGFSENTAPKP